MLCLHDSVLGCALILIGPMLVSGLRVCSEKSK